MVLTGDGDCSEIFEGLEGVCKVWKGAVIRQLP